MWLAHSALSASVLFASVFAAPSPLTTTASTITTLQGPEPGQHGLLVHVLRTEDLIADKMDKQPLLLEKLSHLLIRVELGNETVAVNGHSLPLLPGDQKEPLEVSVKLKQVQMLKMPKNSPLVPLGLTPPELLKIADKYMSEGIVAAMLSVKQEPLSVEAMTEDGTPVEAKAFKVTIAIKILEVDGLSLAETDLPAVDLLHLIVHADASDPSKVARITTLAPQALVDPRPASNPFAGALGAGDMISSALDSTRSSLDSALKAFSGILEKVASRASHMLHGHRLPKPCHKHPHQPLSAAHPAASKPEPVAVAAQSHAAHEHSVKAGSSKLACLIKMAARSSIAILLLGLPLLLVSLIFTSVMSSLIHRHRANLQAPPASYEAVMAEEKMSDDEIVILLASRDGEKC